MELQAMNETLTKKIKDLQEKNMAKVDELKAANDKLTVKVEWENELSVLKSKKSTAIEQFATVAASLNDYNHENEVQAHTQAQLRIETLYDDMNSIHFKLESV
ncbi:hypothetical protein R1sor_025562 [Riccia sorocarpa]|uniref:Uncharacterized protein n=1 Tax=Riccia sorocarpa TaxID=122646 RepID=A0ABD3GB04_9MARC